MTITIALPSKGRMKDDASAIFERAGMKIVAVGNDRSYRGRVEGGTMSRSPSCRRPRFPRDSARLDRFRRHRRRSVREDLPEADKRVEFCARLGFGHADVVVAVPEIWLDVDTMADLGDVAADFRARHGRRLAIATKYWRLTQQFFSSQHGIQLYRIVESLGATEGAPAAGSGRYHRRYHLDRLDADGQSPEDPVGRRHPASRRPAWCAAQAEHEGNARIAEIVAARLAVSVVRSMASSDATDPIEGGFGRFKDISRENWPLVKPTGLSTMSKRRASARAARCAARHRQ
jgi:ATP phosphoribosyltransferase